MTKIRLIQLSAAFDGIRMSVRGLLCAAKDALRRAVLSKPIKIKNETKRKAERHGRRKAEGERKGGDILWKRKRNTGRS